MADPLVTVVMATYNRSNVARLAVESVRRQSLTDWELLVVGDACTDDTSEVLSRLGDERVQFINLPQNCGEQSGPNNFGSERARGRYLAYLNHDDLWLPAHLETGVQRLESTGADLVYGLIDIVRQGRVNRLQGVTRSGRYESDVDVPCSAWIMRRGLWDAVGPWRSYRESWTVPSQDWLFRAHRLGKMLRTTGAMTVVAIQSGCRENCYAERAEAEHRAYWERIQREADFAARELTLICMQQQGERRRSAWKRLAMACGWHPLVVREVLRLHRRGRTIDRLRRTRGLPPLARAAG